MLHRARRKKRIGSTVKAACTAAVFAVAVVFLPGCFSGSSSVTRSTTGPVSGTPAVAGVSATATGGVNVHKRTGVPREAPVQVPASQVETPESIAAKVYAEQTDLARKAERKADASIRAQLGGPMLTPEEKKRILAEVLKGYKPVIPTYEGVVEEQVNRVREQERGEALRRSAIENSLSGKGLPDVAGSGPHKPVGLVETPRGSVPDQFVNTVRNIPTQYYVPIIKPGNCVSELSFPASGAVPGFYVLCPHDAWDRCAEYAAANGLKAYTAPSWDDQGHRTRVLLLGPLHARWKALKTAGEVLQYAGAAIAASSASDYVVFRRTVSNMKPFRPRAGKCDALVEKEIQRFAELCSNPAGRYKALQMYPVLVQHLESAGAVSREALYVFYDSARKLFFDTGYLDLAWDAALTKVRIAGEDALPGDYLALISIAKSIGTPDYEYAAYLAAARGFRNVDSGRALRFYAQALKIKKTRDLLLEVADYLDSLGNYKQAAEFRAQAYRMWE